MSEKIAIGIDLGTTNSAVGVWNYERAELVENKEGKVINECINTHLKSLQGLASVLHVYISQKRILLGELQ